MRDGWTAIMSDKKIEQYPETGEDNTLELSKQIIPNMDQLEEFIFRCGSVAIGFNFKTAVFVIREQQVVDGQPLGIINLPAFIHGKRKLVYFVTRQVTANLGTGENFEHPKIFTVGYEDDKGKILLNLQEGTKNWFFSTEGV